MAFLRSVLYIALIYITVIFHGLFGATIAWLFPFEFRFKVVTSWNKMALWLLAVVCNVRYEIVGLENIPKDGPFVVVSNHESMWETIILQPLFPPLCTILKKELLYVPFFGWALASLEPIAIDRGNPRDAMKLVAEGGLRRLKQGRNVLIFPEGSRNPEKKSKKYTRSAASIAIKAGVPLLPIAHNGATHWPNNSFIKTPGTITLSIGKAIDTSNTDSRQVTEAAQSWIETEYQRINQPS